MRVLKLFQSLICILGVCAIAVNFGCASQGALKQAEMDTPEHHCRVASDLQEKGDLDGALLEFERARGLDPSYSPAYVGVGLVLGEKGNFEDAFRNMDLADRYARTDAHRIAYHTGMIRLYTKYDKDNWLERAESHFSRAIDIDGNHPSPRYFMALAYKKGGEYDRASMQFRKVLELKKAYVEQADQGWEEVQRIVRAMPGSKVGKEIAVLGRITRADVAALFVEEMNLQKIFADRNLSVKNTTEDDADPEVSDYRNHVLKADIEIVNTLGVKGLELVGDRFDPDAEITRSDFALMIEDILVKVTGEKGIQTKYIDAASPFRDIDDGYYAKNAIMTCTTRGIMKADLYGYFRGEAPVSGAEALLVIRRLNEALKF